MTITDGGSPALSTTVSVRVVTTFVNDHAPEVSVVTSDGCEVSPSDGGSAASLHPMTSQKKRYVLEPRAVSKREVSDDLDSVVGERE